MKFTDSLLELYYKHFDTDEHLSFFVYSIIEQLDKEDLLHIIAECDKCDLQDLVACYVIENLDQSKLQSKQKIISPAPFRIDKKRKKIH